MNINGDNKSCHGHHYVNTLLNNESGEIFISNTTKILFFVKKRKSLYSINKC